MEQKIIAAFEKVTTDLEDVQRKLDEVVGKLDKESETWAKDKVMLREVSAGLQERQNKISKMFEADDLAVFRVRIDGTYG